MKSKIVHTALVVALAISGSTWAADFVVPVDVKNVAAAWTKAGVSCQVNGPGYASKSGYGYAPLVNGAFKGNIAVTVDVAPADVPKAKNWYCQLTVNSDNGGSAVGPNGQQPAPNTPFKEHDNGAY